MTCHDPDFWAKAGDVCGLYLNPPDNAVVWSVDEKSGIQAKSRVNPTRPAVPGIAGAPRVRVPPPRHRRAVRRPQRARRRRRRLGHRLDPHATNFVAFLADLVAQTPAGLRAALHRRQPLGPRHPDRRSVPRAATRTSSCTTPRPTPRGSTRSSCSSRSSNGACCATASSTPSTTSPTGSSPSSTTTTVEPDRSAGPTTAAHSRSRNSQ